MGYTAAARAEHREPDLGFSSSASKRFASDVAMEVTTEPRRRPWITPARTSRSSG